MPGGWPRCRAPPNLTSPVSRTRSQPWPAAHEQGADYLKIVIDLPGFDLDTVSALVAAAHARSLRVVAHASRLDAVMMAAAAGVDVLTHVPMDRPLPSSTATELAERGAVLVPTLTMMKAIADRFGSAGRPGPSYESARESVAAAHAAGIAHPGRNRR